MNIKVFAVLKEFFEDYNDVEDLHTIEDVKGHLLRINPGALHLLNSCRFAVNNTFVSLNTTIHHDDTIYVMPPSSGG
jgi:molybdopterin synthase sulfur carrier subunit